MRNLLWLAVWGLLCAGASAPSAAQDMTSVLAPTGRLRIAVYAGSPTSLVKDPRTGEERGVTVEAGRELARRLAVPHDLVVHQRPAEVLQTISAGNADITITNATAERARIVDFGPPVLSLELGFLVREAQKLDISDLEKAGVAIGVSKGSTSEKTLPLRLPQARLVPTANLDEAAQVLLRGDITAFATNKAVLFEMAGKSPGTRVLDGRWGLEHLAIAVPKGRDAAKGFLEAFSLEIKRMLVPEAAARAGLRGQAGE